MFWSRIVVVGDVPRSVIDEVKQQYRHMFRRPAIFKLSNEVWRTGIYGSRLQREYLRQLPMNERISQSCRNLRMQRTVRKVIIGPTTPDQATRAYWIHEFSRYNIPVRFVDKQQRLVKVDPVHYV